MLSENLIVKKPAKWQVFSNPQATATDADDVWEPSFSSLHYELKSLPFFPLFAHNAVTCTFHDF